VGKTTLVTELLANTELKTQLINADELRYREALASQDRQVLGKLFGYEFKRQGEMKKVTRREFSQTYPDAKLQTFTMDNFETFLKN
jgi:adenylate kinase